MFIYMPLATAISEDPRQTLRYPTQTPGVGKPQTRNHCDPLPPLQGIRFGVKLLRQSLWAQMVPDQELTPWLYISAVVQINREVSLFFDNFVHLFQ